MKIRQDLRKGRLIAEWEQQDAVILVWPAEGTDWDYIRGDVVLCYGQIAKTLLKYVNVIIFGDDRDEILSVVGEEGHKYHLSVFTDIPYNDTWVRDYGPLSIDYGEYKSVGDFGFNAWGLKFAANFDNLFTFWICFRSQLYRSTIEYRNLRAYILEGGALDSNGKDVLLSTHPVLKDFNRNPFTLTLDDNDPIKHQENLITSVFTLQKLYSLDVEAMEGDDTDGHIDTMARFVNENTILYNHTDNKKDKQYKRLQKLKSELERVQKECPTIKELIPLPIPTPIYNIQKEQLPATYANFLITNGAVLVPIYGDPMDEKAMEIIGKALPGRVVEGIDCRPLILQGGSLHCATMQIAEGFLEPEFLAQENV